VTFPVERVPDGSVWLPHHLVWGVLVVLLAVWVVSDNLPRQEPLAAMVGILLAGFAFLFIWRPYPFAGAVLTFAGLGLATLGVLYPGGVWSQYPLQWRLVALVGLLVALDDAISHGLGVWTPFDWAWNAYLLPLIL